MKTNRTRTNKRFGLVLVALLVSQQCLFAQFNNVITLVSDGGGSDISAVMRDTEVKPAPQPMLKTGTSDEWVSVQGSSSRYSGDLLWIVDAVYNKADDVGMDGWKILTDKNVIPNNGSFSYTFNPASKSQVGESDWNYLEAIVDSIYAANGLSDDSPEWDRAQALAKCCLAFKGESGNNMDPVDFLKFGQAHVPGSDEMRQNGYCNGAANSMVAMCLVEGIPARIINTYTHSICEVYVEKDGQKDWRFVENMNWAALYFLRADLPRGPMMPYSLYEMIQDPADSMAQSGASWGDRPNMVHQPADMPTRHNYDFEAYSMAKWPKSDAMSDVRWKPVDMYTLSCLYPDKKHFNYINQQKTEPVHQYLTSANGNDYGTRPLGASSSSGLRKQFYMDTKDDLKEVNAYLIVGNAPADKGGWHYEINGKRIDNVSWSTETFTCMGHPNGSVGKALKVSIPIEDINFDTASATSTVRPTVAAAAATSEVSVVGTVQGLQTRVPSAGKLTVSLHDLSGRVVGQYHRQFSGAATSDFSLKATMARGTYVAIAQFVSSTGEVLTTRSTIAAMQN